MKLSLAWIFDHIDANWKDSCIDELAKRFNTVTAEIERFEPLVFELEALTLARVEKQDEGTCTVFAPEWKMHGLELPFRQDAVIGNFYFIKKNDRGAFSWVTMTDFKQDSHALMPAFDVTQELAAGGWRTLFECEDMILDVDNKSLTHRPDMWGHRGFAREIAAFMDLPLKPAEQFLLPHQYHYYKDSFSATSTMPLTILNKAPEVCTRYAGLYLTGVTQRACSLLLASRLLKVGIKPRNGLVDITNYVMLDWSQPVHAYDADTIKEKKVIIRMADQNEKIELLGDLSCELTGQDLVIADGKNPICLAGIKGGASSGISDTTKTVFFEAATFDAGCVRKSAQRHKIRTDSSARFEKTLNATQTTEALFRFKKLLQDQGFDVSYALEAALVGHEESVPSITIEHAFIQARSGLILTQDDIVLPLKKLGFLIEVIQENNKTSYKVTVPAYRASKDIKIKEDIIEEVIRCYGFSRIPLEVPSFKRTSFDPSTVFRLRDMKRFCAYSMHMTEQQNYAFFDEQFLLEIGMTVYSPLVLHNPISENMCRMVSSLIPGLMKNIRDNHVQREHLAFFESSKVWHEESSQSSGYRELRSLAGIIMNKKNSLSFYSLKEQIIELVCMSGFNLQELEWSKITSTEPRQPWFTCYQSVEIFYQKKTLGFLGLVDGKICDALGFAPGSLAAFELDADFLLHKPVEVVQMKPISKFQETFFDLNFMVPLHLSALSLQQLFSKSDDLIVKVDLIDFFEREEWDDQRSLTFRLWLNHAHKTLEKEEIEGVRESVITTACAYGAQLREK